MTTSLVGPHSYPVVVSAADLDFMGHANNATYLTWVQAAVLDQWHRRASCGDIAALRWIALAHDIRYRRPAFAGDHLTADVVLERIQGAKAFYRTVIRRGEIALATVQSSWCCVAAATLKPKRLSRLIVESFLSQA